MASTPYTTTELVPAVLTPNPQVGISATDTIGFYGATAAAQPTITGSYAGNAALHNLLTALATLGLIVDSTTVS